MPVYGGNNGFYTDIVLGYIKMFFDNQQIIRTLGIIFSTCGLAMYTLNLKYIQKYKYLNISAIFFLITIVLIKITNQPWPIIRVLIPFYPLVILSFLEIYEIIYASIRKTKVSNIINYAIQSLIIFVIIMQFSGRTSIISTNDWKEAYKFKDIAYNVVNNHDILSDEVRANWDYIYVVDFYREKILYEYNYDIFSGLNND